MLSGYIALQETQKLFLTAILALSDEPCWDLLEPFVDTVVKVHVMDSEQVSSDASALLEECLARLLQDAAFRPGGHRSGELSGFHMPQLVDALLLVNADDAPRSARFANGDWTEIGTSLPVVDRFVRAAGWSSGVSDRFLTLCERARRTYPATTFADEVLWVLDGMGGNGVGRGWDRTALPARIAGLVQQARSDAGDWPRELQARPVCGAGCAVLAIKWPGVALSGRPPCLWRLASWKANGKQGEGYNGQRELMLLARSARRLFAIITRCAADPASVKSSRGYRVVVGRYGVRSHHMRRNCLQSGALGFSAVGTAHRPVGRSDFAELSAR